MDVLPDNCVALGLPGGSSWCPECKGFRAAYVACLEVVLSGEDNLLTGFQSVVRFRSCWHPVPGAPYMSPILMARLLDDFHEEHP